MGDDFSDRPPTPAGAGPPEPVGQPGMPDPTPEPRRRFSLGGRSLRQHAARQTFINTGFMVALSLLAFIKGFVLAALLTQTDYGVFGITALAVSLIVALRQVGVADKFVQQDEDDQELAFQRAFTLEAIVSGITALLIVAALPLLVLLYDDSRILLPGLVLAANLIAGVLQMPLWVYYRRLEYGRVRLLQAIDPVVAFAVSVALAAAGAGYWALFAGLAAGTWATAIAAVALSPYRLRFRFDRDTLRTYWRFSAPLLLANLGGPVIAQAAIFATDAHLGIAAVGALTLAATVSQFTDRVDYLVTGTLYPAICAVKDRTDVLFESFVKTNRLALMWAVPFGLGLSLFAGDLIQFVIGDKWDSALPLFQAFGVVAAVGHIAFNWDAYFRARGETRPMAVAAVAAAVTFIAVGLPLLFTWGLEGIAVGTAAQMLVHVSFRAYFLQRLFDGFAFLRHALRAFVPALPAAGAILLVRLLEDGERTATLAAAELALYCGATVALTWFLEGRLVREVVGYIRARPAAGTAV
jgi:O-antigen/teichoic acid export membrane protein